jgi:phosphatidylserine/phosphatidylglycerophosphate/cardiolipin synthase-like enzyme
MLTDRKETIVYAPDVLRVIIQGGFVKFLSLILGLFLASSAHAFSIEVVQSVPKETNLQVAGLPLTQDVWLKMINGAKETIDLEEFYVTSQPGEALAPILDAIRAAAGRGVHVRLIVDSGFYKTYPTDPNSLAQVDNIEVKTIDFSSLGGIQHSKFFVVDGDEFYAGSANFDWLALEHIHEIGLHINDASMAQGLESVFNMDWNNTNETRAVSSSIAQAAQPITFARLAADIFPAGYQMMASPPKQTPAGIEDSLTEILKALANAETSFKLQVYEYDTTVFGTSQHWYVLDKAIRAAAARGVQVQLLVDKAALKAGKADLQALATLPNIQLQVITVPAWSGPVIPYSRLIHSKYFIVDGTSAWVGSENWSSTYFTGSRNVGIMLVDPTVISQLNLVFNQVWNSGYGAQP